MFSLTLQACHCGRNLPSPPYQLRKTLGGPQSLFECGGEEKYPTLPIVQPIASHFFLPYDRGKSPSWAKPVLKLTN
jgi:hypothetical protein